MIESTIHTFTYDNEEIQKVQCVKADSFKQLDFFSPEYDEESVLRLYHLYRDYIVHKYERFLGTVVLFHLPSDVDIPFSDEDDDYGKVFDPLAIVTADFRKNIHLAKGKIAFRNRTTEDFYRLLEDRGALHTVRGKRNYLSILPVSHRTGFLSENRMDATAAVNGSFFLMDMLDCMSVFDHVGTPFGLKLKDGIILSPPLFKRQALLVTRDGSVKIEKPSLENIAVLIDGVSYKHEENALFYTRPRHRKTPSGGFDIIVVEDRIVSIKKGGNSIIPTAGFIVHLAKEIEVKDRKVCYGGLEEYSFGIQVGNSAIVEGRKTKRFLSPFYSFFTPSQIIFPPSMYPLNYQRDRAPRIVLGANREGRPILLWFEGAGKFGYEKGKESCGASLAEAAAIAQELGMYNGVHLDGGGSAQILYGQKRLLRLSDRDPVDFSEVERAIPSALCIR